MKKIKVRYLKNEGSYHVGKEIFKDEDLAKDVVDRGVAVYVKQPKKKKETFVKGLGKVEQVEPKQELTKEQKKLESEWIVAQSLLKEYVTNDMSKDCYNERVKDYLLGKDGKCRISWETWKRWYTEHQDETVSKLEDSTEYRDVDGIVHKIEEGIKRSEYGNEQKDFLIWSKNYNRYFVNVDKVADYLIDLFDCKTIYGKKAETPYTCDGKIWKADGRAKIKTTSECLLESYARTKDINEIFEKIKRKTEVDKEEFEKTDINLIPLDNGVWNVKEKKLEKHSPTNNFRFIFEIEKKEDAKCPNFMRFISETCYPDDIPLIQEWFGFNLYRRYFIKKIIILLGEKDTGKSVLLNVLTAFIGDKNKTGISLQKLSSGSDFTKLSLKDKHSNIFDDLPASDLKNSGNFKMAVGDGWIAGEEKFGDYQQFRNFAKHTMAANKIPPVKDNDDMAYFERIMITRFDNTPDKMDLFLIDKLTTPRELSGILNWALDGLYRLLEDRKFSYRKTAEETKVIMETSGNPLLQFAKDVLIENPEGKVTKDQMFEVYSLWANEFDKQKLTKNQLSIQLHKVVKYMIDKREKIRFWGNVSLKPEWATKINPIENIDKNQKKLDLSENIEKIDESSVILGGKSSKVKEQIDELDDFKSKPCSKKVNISGIDIIKNKASNSSKNINEFTDEEIKVAGLTKEEFEELND